MGAMMALRTALAYFLSKEIKELEEEEEKHEEKHNAGHAKQQVRPQPMTAHLCFIITDLITRRTGDFCALNLCPDVLSSHQPHLTL